MHFIEGEIVGFDDDVRGWWNFDSAFCSPRLAQAGRLGIDCPGLPGGVVPESVSGRPRSRHLAGRPPGGGPTPCAGAIDRGPHFAAWTCHGPTRFPTGPGEPVPPGTELLRRRARAAAGAFAVMVQRQIDFPVALRGRDIPSASDQCSASIEEQADHAADQGAVDTDELQVLADVQFELLGHVTLVPAAYLIGDELADPFAILLA